MAHAVEPPLVRRELPLAARAVLVAMIALGVAARLSVLLWQEPWTPHHPDEHALPLEALGLWEGVTPREVGWPASTTRLLLSGAAAVRWAVEDTRDAWQLRHEPDRGLGLVSSWIGKQYIDPTTMFRLGRGLSLVTGLLQLVVTWWALGYWSGAVGRAVGTAGAAISPLAVLHSQYILADMTGVLFAMAVVGLAARPTPGRVLAMAALAALAAASKLHFGVWLLTPLVTIAYLDSSHTTARGRVKLLLGVLGVFAFVMVLLVPWWLINPVLALKELGGVVGAKLGEPAGGSTLLTRLPLLFGGMGVLTWFGAVLGLGRFWRLRSPEGAIVLPLLVGAVALLTSGVVFDRYALVLLPGMLALSAAGWEHWLSFARSGIQRAAVAAVSTCLVLSTWQVLRAERVAAEIDVDVLVKQWIMSHVPRGRRIATYDEWLLFLPRTADQLRRCAVYPDSPAAYREKWAIEGVAIADDVTQPMRAALLTDELFAAYWCRRELTVQKDPGYVVVPYHPTPRFGAMLESNALSAFRTGPIDGREPIDALVLNRMVDVGVPPAYVVQTQRGQRVVYLRPDCCDAGVRTEIIPTLRKAP